MSLESAKGKTLDKVFGTEPLQVADQASYKSCLGCCKKKKINKKKYKTRIKKKNTEDCPLVLKENAAGILSVVNAAAVQLKSFFLYFLFCHATKTKQLFTILQCTWLATGPTVVHPPSSQQHHLSFARLQFYAFTPSHKK